MKQQVKNDEEAEKLAQKNASAGYVGGNIVLTLDDIEHLMQGGMIYQTCNQEYGVTVEIEGKVPFVTFEEFLEKIKGGKK